MSAEFGRFRVQVMTSDAAELLVLTCIEPGCAEGRFNGEPWRRSVRTVIAPNGEYLGVILAELTSVARTHERYHERMAERRSIAS